MKVSNLILLLAIQILSFVRAPAQEPDIEWSKYYQLGSPTEGWDMIQTSDGGYAMIGSFAESYSNTDVYLMKTNNDGDTLWTRSYGGDLDDAGRSIKQTSDQGFIITGYTASFGSGGTDLYLIRTDSLGDTVWTRTYGGEVDEVGRCVALAGNNGFVATGWTSSFGMGGDDVYFVKTDSDGNLVWQETYGTSSTERGWSVRPTPSGRYGIAGWTEYDLDSGIFFILANFQGDETVRRFLDGIEARAIINMDYMEYEGFIICGGYKESYFNYSQVTLLRITVLGYLMWQHSYGYRVIGHCIDRTMDGGYIVGGYGTGNNGDAYIVKTRSDGILQWEKRITLPSGTKVRAIKQTPDGGYVFFGYDPASAFLYKLSSELSGNDDRDANIPESCVLKQNYPNPFNAVTVLYYSLPFEGRATIEIYNIGGEMIKTVFDGFQSAGSYSVTWDASAFPSGVYFARLEAGGISETVKMVLLK